MRTLPTRRHVAVLALALAIPGAALAHHGWSAYDSAKAIKATGPLTSVTWRNPHGEAKMMYEGKTWAVILAPTSRMESRGLTQDMLKDGTAATVEGYPRTDGTPEMRLERITVAGKTIELR
jgi:hypothetical protein